MELYDLTAIVSSQKKSYEMRSQIPSFRIAPPREAPYIPPTFTKSIFERERPAVILVSAVGATGKSTLAQVLSHQTGLPLLDLGKHKPVGDNTLTGLLTSGFQITDLTSIFDGLDKGTYGVIVDGIDEGRAKTSEKAFHAFLDDIVKLCPSQSNTTFVLLGRTQILDDCWVYLTDKGVSTGLVSIAPFGVDAARRYIDAFTEGLDSQHRNQYEEVRDEILRKLSSAFSSESTRAEDHFASFIGYPPVLDAIVTLLKKEANYHRVKSHLESSTASNMEIDLLYGIASCIVERERDQKVMPNIVAPLLADLPSAEKEAIAKTVYDVEEQCIRLVAYCLGKEVRLQKIVDPIINDKYEEMLSQSVQEHPFIAERKFRNVVFEAVALAMLVSSTDAEAVRLGLEYLNSEKHKYNYHFVYFLHRLAKNQNVPIACIHALLGSALEFTSPETLVETRLEAKQNAANDAPNAVDIEVEILMGPDGEESKTFLFQSEILDGVPVQLCSRLSSTYAILPCDVILASGQEIEFTAPVLIAAKKIVLNSPAIVARVSKKRISEGFIVLEGERFESTVANIQTNGGFFVVSATGEKSLTYPLAQYSRELPKFQHDPNLHEKYLRLKRILVEFRSHSRGTMARFKPKIENERVSGNPIGKAILERLLQDGVLTLERSHYFLQPDNVHMHLGISWIDLQKGQTSERLVQYLSSIKT